MNIVKSDLEVIDQIFEHIDNQTTDRGDEVWHEPTDNYLSQARFDAEIDLLKHLPLPFAPSAVLAEPGSYVAHRVAGVPVVVTRDRDMTLRAFRNACRHRGVLLAEGSGKTNVLRCPYHGWAYATDGSLTHVPHASGFPGLNKEQYGLTPIHSVTEKSGIVFVCVEEPIDDGALASLPPLLNEKHKVFDTNESEMDFNWKLNTEATLEGYHIKPTHETTFYPYGYDNLNVVETFGRNSRITYPFRRIEDLRDVAREQRDIAGKVTYVYNLFPTGTVAVLTNHISLSISEPIAPGKTQLYSYRMGSFKADQTEEELKKMRRDANFVADSGQEEDNAVVRRIQAGLQSGANKHFTFGHFEKAIVQLLKNLELLISNRSGRDS